MTKVSAKDDDIIYRGDHLTIRAVRRRNGSMPAKEWFATLDPKLQVRVHATARVLENSWRVDRPDPEKWSKVRGYDLWEFRATSKKAQPSLRFYGAREGQTMWAAIGIAKKSQKTKRSDATLALRVLEERQR